MCRDLSCRWWGLDELGKLINYGINGNVVFESGNQGVEELKFFIILHCSFLYFNLK